MNPLLDVDFLKKLDAYPHRTVYAKIILLNFDEQPIKEIQGRITAGSVNIDGASVIRRSCSLTMITQEKEIDSIYWGLKNKFKLEVGLENFIDSHYPDIIWFKQGLYLITSLSESLNGTNHNISLSGKDKGCLLNGEIGGTIPSTTNFSKIDYNEIDSNGNYITTTTDLPIKTIIQNAVVSFGGESPHNIILNDVDSYGMELMAYKGENNLYMLYDEESGLVTNMTFNGKQSYIKVEKREENGEVFWDEIENILLKDAIPNNYVDQAPKDNRTFFKGENNRIYSVIIITKDESVGYRKTNLTYPGDLIANAGETLSSVLDKIKNMFTTFEYFYDIDGRFVFQEKKNYINSTWNPIEVSEDEIYVNAAAITSPTIYSFEDNQMLTAISKQPALLNLKNDFSIQGTRKTATGADVLIHMRYAIANKPIYYVTMDGKVYFTKDAETKLEQFKEQKRQEYRKVDWREIIYQMALDYFKYNQDENFLSKIRDNNTLFGSLISLYPTGKTGYEMFYTDMQGFWRQIYNPDAMLEKDKGDYIELPIFAGTTGMFSTSDGFHEDVSKNPAVLNFWFDFMDTGGDMGQYSIETIGHRPKAINDSKTVAIYYKQVPQVLFITDRELEGLKKENLQDYYNLSGYNFIQIPTAYEKYFSISSRGKSAQDSLDELLYEHLYCTENITLTSLPIYYLQPNHRIFVRDKKTQINGEYLINKITIPLTYNGTSSITAQLAPTRLY